MNIHPSQPSTIVDSVKNEWIPISFDSFLDELNHILEYCKNKDSLPLFRGHRNKNWLLDSTFVRSFKTSLFKLPSEDRLSPRIVNSEEFHPAILNLFLLKFGVLMRPSDELEKKALQHDLDAWFEFMKRVQQYPETENASEYLKGTNLLDWSKSPEVALYFANENRNSDGAIYICDSKATGKTLQTLPVGEILDKMSELGKAGKQLGSPLLFSPKNQVLCQRAKNQQAVYFAQMDLRYDLEHIWKLYEKENSSERVLIKLILPAGSETATNTYLADKGIIQSFIYPNEEIN